MLIDGPQGDLKVTAAAIEVSGGDGEEKPASSWPCCQWTCQGGYLISYNSGSGKNHNINVIIYVVKPKEARALKLFILLPRIQDSIRTSQFEEAPCEYIPRHPSLAGHAASRSGGRRSVRALVFCRAGYRAAAKLLRSDLR